jgi:hypothetical protein
MLQRLFVGRAKPQATGFTKCEEHLGNTPSNSALNKSEQVFTFMRNPKDELRVVLFSNPCKNRVVCRLEETTFQANEIVGIRGKELILVAAMTHHCKALHQVVAKHFFKWVLCGPQFLSESGKSNYMVRSQRISNISLKPNFY